MADGARWIMVHMTFINGRRHYGRKGPLLPTMHPTATLD